MRHGGLLIVSRFLSCQSKLEEVRPVDQVEASQDEETSLRLLERQSSSDCFVCIQ